MYAILLIMIIIFNYIYIIQEIHNWSNV